MRQLEISKMTLDDYEEIKDRLISEFDNFWTPEILKSEIIGENKYYIVAKKEQEIVGFAGILLTASEAEIMNLVTKKSKRNHGIGKALLEKLIEIAKNNHLKTIFLEVKENHEVARKIYENAGFEKIGMRKNYYPSGENAILMSKKVNIL